MIHFAMLAYTTGSYSAYDRPTNDKTKYHGIQYYSITMRLQCLDYPQGHSSFEQLF
jgi:hypothetical protein